jgi:uncharacterized protein
VTDQPETDQSETDDSASETDDTESADEVAEPEETASEVAETDVANHEDSEAEVPSSAGSTVPAPTATAVLTHVVRSIVDDADAVRVDAVEGRNRLKLEVKVGPGDLGRVIGRRGRTAQSIRTVVRAAATRDGVEVDVDFVD